MLRQVFILVFLSTCLLGCAKQGDIKDYVPPEETARQALTSALDAWKSGKTPDQIGASKPGIQAQVKQWTDGKKLAAYEIVGPATGDDQNRRFAVKLTLDGSATPEETSFVVVGKDPIWVFGNDNFQRLSGM